MVSLFVEFFLLQESQRLLNLYFTQLSSGINKCCIWTNNYCNDSITSKCRLNSRPTHIYSNCYILALKLHLDWFKTFYSAYFHRFEAWKKHNIFDRWSINEGSCSFCMFSVSNCIQSPFDHKIKSIQMHYMHWHSWPWSTKPVTSHWGIFVAIAKNTFYG